MPLSSLEHSCSSACSHQSMAKVTIDIFFIIYFLFIPYFIYKVFVNKKVDPNFQVQAIIWVSV